MDQYSPKPSSPSGFPVANQLGTGPGGGADASGGLKLKISLNQNKTPFYLMKAEQVATSETTGATNLMAARGLEHSYNKLTTKKMKDSLSAFLPHLPGMVDTPGSQDNSSLRGIIEKPPVCGKELQPLNQLQLSGFRLHPGPLPEQYRALTLVHPRKKHKQKRSKHRGVTGLDGGGLVGDASSGGGEEGSRGGDEERERRREKKHKKHDKDAEERKKKKKEKKKKRNKEDKDL